MSKIGSLNRTLQIIVNQAVAKQTGKTPKPKPITTPADIQPEKQKEFDTTNGRHGWAASRPLVANDHIDPKTRKKILKSQQMAKQKIAQPQSGAPASVQDTTLTEKKQETAMSNHNKPAPPPELNNKPKTTAPDNPGDITSTQSLQHFEDPSHDLADTVGKGYAKQEDLGSGTPTEPPVPSCQTFYAKLQQQLQEEETFSPNLEIISEEKTDPGDEMLYEEPAPIKAPLVPPPLPNQQPEELPAGDYENFEGTTMEIDVENDTDVLEVNSIEDEHEHEPETEPPPRLKNKMQIHAHSQDYECWVYKKGKAWMICTKPIEGYTCYNGKLYTKTMPMKFIPEDEKIGAIAIRSLRDFGYITDGAFKGEHAGQIVFQNEPPFAVEETTQPGIVQPEQQEDVQPAINAFLEKMRKLTFDQRETFIKDFLQNSPAHETYLLIKEEQKEDISIKAMQALLNKLDAFLDIENEQKTAEAEKADDLQDTAVGSTIDNQETRMDAILALEEQLKKMSSQVRQGIHENLGGNHPNLQELFRKIWHNEDISDITASTEELRTLEAKIKEIQEVSQGYSEISSTQQELLKKILRHLTTQEILVELDKLDELETFINSIKQELGIRGAMDDIFKGIQVPDDDFKVCREVIEKYLQSNMDLTKNIYQASIEKTDVGIIQTSTPSDQEDAPPDSRFSADEEATQPAAELPELEPLKPNDLKAEVPEPKPPEPQEAKTQEQEPDFPEQEPEANGGDEGAEQAASQEGGEKPSRRVEPASHVSKVEAATAAVASDAPASEDGPTQENQAYQEPPTKDEEKEKAMPELSNEQVEQIALRAKSLALENIKERIKKLQEFYQKKFNAQKEYLEQIERKVDGQAEITVELNQEVHSLSQSLDQLNQSIQGLYNHFVKQQTLNELEQRLEKKIATIPSGLSPEQLEELKREVNVVVEKHTSVSPEIQQSIPVSDDDSESYDFNIDELFAETEAEAEAESPFTPIPTQVGSPPYNECQDTAVIPRNKVDTAEKTKPDQKIGESDWIENPIVRMFRPLKWKIPLWLIPLGIMYYLGILKQIPIIPHWVSAILYFPIGILAILFVKTWPKHVKDIRFLKYFVLSSDKRKRIYSFYGSIILLGIISAWLTSGNSIRAKVIKIPYIKIDFKKPFLKSKIRGKKIKLLKFIPKTPAWAWDKDPTEKLCSKAFQNRPYPTYLKQGWNKKDKITYFTLKRTSYKKARKWFETRMKAEGLGIVWEKPLKVKQNFPSNDSKRIYVLDSKLKEKKGEAFSTDVPNWHPVMLMEFLSQRHFIKRMKRKEFFIFNVEKFSLLTFVSDGKIKFIAKDKGYKMAMASPVEPQYIN